MELYQRNWFELLTSLQATDGLVFTLGLVALGDHRGDTNEIEISTGISRMSRTNSYEQQALLTPDMVAEEQWIDLKGLMEEGLTEVMRDLRRGVVRSVPNIYE